LNIKFYLFIILGIMVKTICTVEECTSRVVRIIGECKYCSSQYCGKHRLPEDHLCKNMNDVKKRAFEINEVKVLDGQCVGKKIESF
jgi:predicted nucleic acid binding AN1-type Zn finger protein